MPRWRASRIEGPSRIATGLRKCVVYVATAWLLAFLGMGTADSQEASVPSVVTSSASAPSLPTPSVASLPAADTRPAAIEAEAPEVAASIDSAPPSEPPRPADPAAAPVAIEAIPPGDEGAVDESPQRDGDTGALEAPRATARWVTPERIDQELMEIRELIERAHYRTALAIAGETRKALEASDPSDELKERRAQLEVLCATSEVALGRDGAALGRMREALRADPLLELDTRVTSPKVLALLDRARRDSGAGAAPESVAP